MGLSTVANLPLCVRRALADLIVESTIANEFPQHNASGNPDWSDAASSPCCLFVLLAYEVRLLGTLWSRHHQWSL